MTSYALNYEISLCYLLLTDLHFFPVVKGGDQGLVVQTEVAGSVGEDRRFNSMKSKLG